MLNCLLGVEQPPMAIDSYWIRLSCRSWSFDWYNYCIDLLVKHYEAFNLRFLNLKLSANDHHEYCISFQLVSRQFLCSIACSVSFSCLLFDETGDGLHPPWSGHHPQSSWYFQCEASNHSADHFLLRDFHLVEVSECFEPGFFVSCAWSTTFTYLQLPLSFSSVHLPT